MIGGWKHFFGMKLCKVGTVAAQCERSDRELDHLDFRFRISGEVGLVCFKRIEDSFFIRLEELF